MYGYVKSKEDHHKLVIDEYAADVVREIFKWKLEGFSQQRIADRLNERGELSPMEYKRFCGLNYQSGFQVNPQVRWTAVTVGRILRNECYIGTLIQGKRTTPNHKIKKVIQKPREEWIRIKKNHPPVIEKEDFLAVEKLLLQDTRVAPKEETVYLLSGLVFCGDCKQNMVRNSVYQNGKTYVYYMCGNNRTNQLCSSHRIRACLLEQTVFLSLKQHIETIVHLEHVLASIEALPYHQVEIEKINRNLLKKQEEEARYAHLRTSLYESLMDELIDKNEYLELKVLYDEKIQEIQSAEKKLKQELEDLLQNRSSHAFWIEQFKKYQNLTEFTRHIAVTLIDRIEVYEDSRIQIQFRYQDQYERAQELVESVSQLHLIKEIDEKREVV